MMSDRLTIPAACLEALGGLREEDPPVLVLTPGVVWPWHPVSLDADPLLPADRILVQQSAPALIAVLERVCPAPALCDWLMVAYSSYMTHDWSVVSLDLLAHCVIAEATRAHGSDAGWTVEASDGE
jgi:hypothetical protein